MPQVQIPRSFQRYCMHQELKRGYPQCVYADTVPLDPVVIGDAFRWETTDMRVVGFEDNLVLMQDDNGATYGYEPHVIGAVWAI